MSLTFVCPELRYRSGDTHTSGMFEAAALLESYQRQIQSVEGRLKEADENIDTVREVPLSLHRIRQIKVLLRFWADRAAIRDLNFDTA